jgi:small subunit ribosomal protein S4e
MAHKKSDHLSRLAAPKTWPIERKSGKWITKPDPGAHSLQRGLPIAVMLTEVLKFTKDKAEVKRALKEKLVLVNGNPVKEANFSVGLFDTVKVLKYNKFYRILIDHKGRLKPVEIPEKELDTIVVRVEGKTTVKGNKTQINFSNGWNLLVEKDDYKVNDVVLLGKDKKPVKHLKLEKGSLAYVVGGAHSGKLSEIREILQEGVLRKSKFIIGKHKDEKIKVPIEDIFVIGKDNPEITLQ